MAVMQANGPSEKEKVMMNNRLRRLLLTKRIGGHLNQPNVSVIMPSLNVAPYIRECMESVVNQTLNDIEIICVDAGSTDGTLEVLEEYAARDQRITLIHSDMKSYGYQMNLGIAAAKGEYIGIVETDDFVAPDMFEILYDSAKRKNAEVVKSNYYEYNTLSNSSKKCNNNLGLKYGKVISPANNARILRTVPSIWSGIYKKSFLSTNNIQFLETPDASFQDTGFILKVFLSAHRVLLLKDAFVYYRTDNENSSVNSGEKAYCICEEIDSVQKFISERPEKKAVFQEYLWAKYFDTYMWNYYRISDHLRLDFACTTKAFFEKSLQNGEISRKVFSESDWAKLSEIISSPESFYSNNRMPTSLPAFEKTDKEHDIVSKAPRNNALDKLRGAIQCFRDNGAAYTFRRALYHVGLWKDEEA